MRSLFLATVFAASIPIVANAQTFRASNELNVVPLGRATFEVIEARGEGPRGMWCAAADYAERRLGVTRGRVYISGALGPARQVSGRKSVVFTTDVNSLKQSPFQSTSLNTSQVGMGLPIAHAIQFCRPDDYDITERLLRRN